MKNILLTAAWEIFDLSAANNVDIGIARDMFCENLSTYDPDKPISYIGAEVDYDALAPVWQAMTPSEQAEAKILYKNATQATYDQITAARRENNKAAFYLALLGYVAPEKAPAPDYVLYRNAWDIWAKANEDGTTLETAKNAWCEASAEWASLSDEDKVKENQWFAEKVVGYDQGLKYCVMTGNKDLFMDVLATR